MSELKTSAKQTKSTKKKKSTKNTFDIVQFKKMIGKGLITVWNGLVIDKKAISEDIKKVKEKILSKSIKSIAMTGYTNNGVLYIFSGIDRLLGINGVSYSDLKKAQLDSEIEIIINQYPKLTKEEILSLIS